MDLRVIARTGGSKWARALPGQKAVSPAFPRSYGSTRS